MESSRGQGLRGLESQAEEPGSFPRPRGSHGSDLRVPLGAEGDRWEDGRLGKRWGESSWERTALDLSHVVGRLGWKPWSH